MEKLNFSERIIKMTFDFSVRCITSFHKMDVYNQKVDELRKLPPGTLGNDIAKCLDSHGLRLVPKFESHDLKHVLLEYEMTPLDEIRLQAFMLGNRNYTLPCFAILWFGLIFLPNKHATFYNDFKRGRNSVQIKTWSIENYGSAQTSELRKSLLTQPKPQPTFSLETLTRLGAFTSILAGIFGMLFCLPFLFSSSMEDLVGAGFPFVGGSILAVGGLLSLSNLSRGKGNYSLTSAANTL